jgi:hypothetical protein
MYINSICWLLVIQNPSAHIFLVSLVNALMEPSLDPIAKSLLLSLSSLSRLVFSFLFSRSASYLERLHCLIALSALLSL